MQAGSLRYKQPCAVLLGSNTLATVGFEGVTKTYSSGRGAVRALNNLHLFVENGEFLVLVGPSGCGKTTTLRVAAGLEQLDRGRITIGGRDMARVPPQDRDVAMVFQHQALYDHMTVAENLAFGLKVRGIAADLIQQRVGDVLQLLEMSHVTTEKPTRLSGGEQQRVALGRALVRRPNAFLLDEPLSNVDPTLRLKLRGEIKRIQRAIGGTMIYVTHDQEEAMALADRILLLKDGVVQQIGPPLDLYENPTNRFVASFFGSPPMSFLEGRVEKQRNEWFFVGSLGRLRLSGDLAAGVPAHHVLEPISLGIRPEHLRIVNEPDRPDTGRKSRGTGDFSPIGRLSVAALEEMGGSTRAYLRGAGGTRLVLNVLPSEHLAVGQEVPLSVDLSRLFLFGGADGARMLKKGG